MSVVWTEDQRKVINIRNRNLLVSAAAGSGKTAVLVERIVSLITDKEHPVDVDRLLITTFTKAAAGEMKERIGKALSERLKEDPHNEWLQRQESLVHRAQITTIHGFCLYVIRNYFHTIDLAPNFRIADEGEMKLLKQDIAHQIVEEYHRQKDPAFIRFADSYGNGNRGNGLEDMILKLYEYAIASPQPEKWLWSCADAYDMPEDGSWSDFAGQEELLAELHTAAGDLLTEIQKARKLAQLPDGPQAYEEALAQDEQQLTYLVESDSVECFQTRLEGVSYARLPSRRSKAMAGVDDALIDQVMELRSVMKDGLKDLQKQYFDIPSEEQFAQLRATAELVRTYVQVTLSFMERLTAEKRRKNILDFADQEHLALKILTREVDGKLVPSETADLFADYFAEIMVDEYQDSNLVQEAILDSISKSRRGRDNRFMVGDVKQSIYRFRQAEPGLFLEKYARYGTEDGGVRVDLHQNFRSRKEVLDLVNVIFERIMRKEVGGIEYDEEAALKAGAAYPETETTKPELLVLTKEEWEKLEPECRWTKVEAEAHLIAGRIRKLMEEGQVTEDGKLRPVRYGDIVILLRTMSGWSETFVRVLQEEGIPACAQSREGYFQTVEVETLLAYLRILDNPTQEIPLAASMHGLLGGFTSTELAQIRAGEDHPGFYDACRAYAENGEQEELRQKLQRFFAQMENYRQRATYTSVHDLLWEILTETGYLDQIRALPGGEQRLANVEMLLAKARDYEKISYHGLFHFVRYIERMKKYQMDFGEAAMTGKNGEAVQIMSTHHSKGLEFPVVFAAGLGKTFNKQDAREKVVCHNRWGLGLDYVDLDQRMRRATLVKRLIRRQNQQDSLGEELRILYVALTRAKEKLILTGMIPEKVLGEKADEQLSFTQITSADSYFRWIIPALSEDTCGKQSLINVKMVSLETVIREQIRQTMTRELSRTELEQSLLYGKKDEELYNQINERLSWSYPWKMRETARQKYSVTELKKLRMQEESDAAEELYPETDMVPLIPQFIQKTEEKTGAARGTIYHTVMEWLDFEHLIELRGAHVPKMKAELQTLVDAGKLSEEELRAVNPMDLLDLAESDLSERMAEAASRGELFREQPFVMGLPASQVDGSDSDETILIQGIIDAFFYEDGQIVLLDYKTDYVRRASELREKYHAQLEYYEQALSMMTGKKVKEKLIYSFTLGEVIEV